jgi:hypothetical protein
VVTGSATGRLGRYLQRQAGLQPVEFLALARTKELAFQPDIFRFQGRQLRLQLLELGEKLFGGRHAGI